MGGESASCTSDRGYYLPTNSSEGHMNSDDDGCVIDAWASAAENLWDSGNFIWTQVRKRPGLAYRTANFFSSPTSRPSAVATTTRASLRR